MDETLLKILRALAHRSMEAQSEITALKILLTTKHVISQEDSERFVQIVQETRRDLLRRQGQPEQEALEELLRKFEGPIQ